MVARRMSWAYIAVVSFLTIVSTATAKYSGGTGEPNDPYQIATAADLILLGETPADYDKHFILTADIDLDPNLPGRKVFDKAVIAPDTNAVEGYFQGMPFSGVLDANSHTISHLTIKGGDYLGLFGLLQSGSEVRDVSVVDVNLVGSGDYVGGLGGLAGGKVLRCHSSGTVTGNDNVGGLVGYSTRGEITASSSDGNVRGYRYVGGVLGYSNAGRVSLTSSKCEITGYRYVGGLVGYNHGGSISSSCSTEEVTVEASDVVVGGLVGLNDTGSIFAAYSRGDVTGYRYVGGLVGDNYDSIISSSYSSGAVTGYWLFGGLVATNRGKITRSCWDVNTTGLDFGVGFGSTDGITGLSTQDMQKRQAWIDVGWDFVGEMANGMEDIWKIAEGLDYPRLWWEPYDGRVTVGLGQVFTVTLESNPSTGYRWEWVDHQDSIVDQIGQAQFKPRETGDPPLVGAGGWETFDFKAVSQGQMTLKLVYRRPWEEGVEPLKTFSLQVTVP